MSAGTETLDRIVRQMVVDGTGLPPENVIPGNDPNPAPQRLYATVLFMSESHPGTPEVRYTLSQSGDDVQAHSKIYTRSVYSVQFYREGAVITARLFRAWCFSPLGVEAQIARSTHIARLSDTRRIDAIIQDTPEERTVIDMEIDTPLTLTQNVGRVREIPHDTRIGEIIQTGEVSNGP